MKLPSRILVMVIVSGSLLASCVPASAQQAAPATASSPNADPIAAVRAQSEKLVAAFNQGDAEAVASLFLPKGELIDETGRINSGRDEIQGLLAALFEQYPGVQLTLSTESIRPLGPAVFEEGTRTLTANDGSAAARFRYIDLWVQADSGWSVASHREFAEDPTPTPRDYLESIAWLEGKWINEGADGSVAIEFTWSDDQNYLLGKFAMRDAEGNTRTSSQRIGWDPRSGHIRSWLFDADGGFSEGVWSVVDEGIVIKSTSVNPDGSDASVTITLSRTSEDQFTFVGSERIIGGVSEPDFELTITRSPPQPLNQ